MIKSGLDWPFSFCKKNCIQPWKAIQSWQFVFIKLLLPELISKKAPSNPWIADNSTKKSAQGWDLHLTFIFLSSKKVDGSKTKWQTNKNTWTPIHTHEQPWTSMDTHDHLSAHEHPWIHMNSCFSKHNAAGKLLVEPYVSQFLNFLFWVVGYVSFWFNCFFLNWTLILFLCFIFFWFCPVVVSRPEKKLLIFANYVFYLFIYSYLFFLYVFIQVYLYIYVCVMFCIYIYNYVYIYIYKCVWGEGCLKMRCPFFLSKNPFRNRKKTPRFDMCFLFLSCVGLSHPKYMFSGFLLYVVFSASFYRKNVSNQKMFHWRLQYR